MFNCYILEQIQSQATEILNRVAKRWCFSLLSLPNNHLMAFHIELQSVHSIQAKTGEKKAANSTQVFLKAVCDMTVFYDLGHTIFSVT